MPDDTRSITIAPRRAITNRPPRALLPWNARQIVPVVGAAAALVWGASRIVMQVVRQRRQQQRLQAAEETLSRPIIVYRRVTRITISGRE